MQPYREAPDVCARLALPSCDATSAFVPDLRRLLWRTRLRWAAACVLCALSASVATMALAYAHRPTFILPGESVRMRLKAPPPTAYSPRESVLAHSGLYGAEAALERAYTLASLGVDLPVVETSLGAGSYHRLDGQGDDFSALEPVLEHERVTSLRVGDLARSPLLEAAGFRAGDVVVSIDGEPVGSRPTPRAYPGRLAVYEVQRGGRLVVLAVRWRR
jgi:hypothetical protein